MLGVEWQDLYRQNKGAWFCSWRDALLKEHGSYLSELTPCFQVVGAHYLVKHTPVGNLAFGVWPDGSGPALDRPTDARRLVLSTSYSAAAQWHVVVRGGVLDLLNTQTAEPLIRSSVPAGELPPRAALADLGRTLEYATRLAFSDVTEKVVEALSRLKVGLASYTSRMNGSLHELLNALVLFRFLEDRHRERGDRLADVFDEQPVPAPAEVFRRLMRAHCLKQDEVEQIASLSMIEQLGPDATAVVRDMLHSLYSDSSSRDLRLDFNLLATHALGPLYDRYVADIEWLPSHEASLLGERPAELRGARAAGTHYTPEPLARALVKEALALFPRSQWPALRVADLACGSGVFLTVFLEELAAARIDVGMRVMANLSAYDVLESAVSSAKLCVGLTAYCLKDGIVPGFSPRETDTLELYVSSPSCLQEQYDLVLMNPPFKGYQEQTDWERKQVAKVLGPLARLKPDLSTAFLRVAVDALRPAGVLGILMPRSFLDSSSSAPLRRHIKDSCSIHAVSLFEEYTLFSRGEVSVVALVLRKVGPGNTAREAPAKTLVCRSDMPAAVLAWERGEYRSSPQWDLFRSDTAYWQDRWQPLPQDKQQLLRRLQSMHPPLTSLFRPCQGIRIGNKRVLEVPDRRQFPRSEQAFLRPIADDETIRAWRIRPDSRGLVYLYEESGLIPVDRIADLAPKLYSYLMEHEKELRQAAVLKGKELGALGRPRPENWMFAPKIVCPYFGLSGCFAFDEGGVYAVTNGHYFLPASGLLSLEEWYYYLAVMNSAVFFELVSCVSPKLKGAQYRLDRKYLAALPLPVFGEAVKMTKDRLVSLARAAESGGISPSGVSQLTVLAADAYGLSEHERAVFGLPEGGAGQ